MKDLYRNMIVDITDPQCEFIAEFDTEVKKYGAVVYNHESNSYQYIRHFEDIDYKKELLPDFVKVEQGDELLKGLKVSVHYEFDPETEEDEENLDIWNNELSKVELPYYNYDEDGEVYDQRYYPISTAVTVHTIWFLKPESADYIMDCDLLMLSPIIKDINIARKLIKEYGIHPFAFVMNEKDRDYKIPDIVLYHLHHHNDEHEQNEDEGDEN